MVPGIIFLVLGVLVFFILEEARMLIEISPFSMALILLWVAGFFMLGISVGSLLTDHFS